jgi:hypothetical protein
MIRAWGDGDIKTSGVQFVDGQAETAAELRYRLRLFLGERFLDVRDGTPWFQQVLGKVPQDVAEVAIKRRILRSGRVLGLRDFRFTTDRDQRRITIDAQVLDRDSEVVRLQLDEDLI